MTRTKRGKYTYATEQSDIAGEITVGVSLYADSETVRWLYLACRCPSCGLTTVYGAWNNELDGYRALLEKV